MRDAGYVHNPPEIEAGANGVTMDPSGSFILVADMYQARIYRVDIATETAEVAYQHEFGVNVARADSNGGIWISQSTRNVPEENSAGLWKSVNSPVADGALLYLAPEKSSPVVLADGFTFANGLALDEENGIIYLAETMGGRIWKFNADFASGTVSDQAVAFEINSPDNLELDEDGLLWVACALHMKLVVADPVTGITETVFRISSPEGEKLIKEIDARLEKGEPWLELVGPDLWKPFSHLLTGLILDPEKDIVYVTGLGNNIIKLEKFTHDR